MNKVIPLLAITGAVAGFAYMSWEGVKKYKQVQHFEANLNVDNSFGRVHGMVKGKLRLIFKSTIRNYTGIDINITQVYIKIESSPDNINWTLLAISPQRYTSISLPDSNNPQVYEFAIDLGLLGAVQEAVNGNIKNLRISFHYSYASVVMDPIQTYINISALIVGIKSSPIYQKIIGLWKGQTTKGLYGMADGARWNGIFKG
jgi:hypothetical protein